MVEPVSPQAEGHRNQNDNGPRKPSSVDENCNCPKCVNEEQEVDVFGADETVSFDAHSRMQWHKEVAEQFSRTTVLVNPVGGGLFRILTEYHRFGQGSHRISLSTDHFVPLHNSRNRSWCRSVMISGV